MNEQTRERIPTRSLLMTVGLLLLITRTRENVAGRCTSFVREGAAGEATVRHRDPRVSTLMRIFAA